MFTLKYPFIKTEQINLPKFRKQNSKLMLMIMPTTNVAAVIVAALVPCIIGGLYYGPVLGKPWLASLGKSADEMKPNQPILAYGLAILMAALVAISLNMVVQLVHKDVNDAGELYFNTFRTFKHGALHGALMAISFVVPVIISHGIFQKISAKNILLNSIFWIICFTLMTGILDAWH